MVSITRKGYIELYYGDSLLSRHTALEEAFERALVHLAENQATEGYTGLYRVKYPDREIDLSSILVKEIVRTPGVPQNFAAQATGASSIALSWQQPAENPTYVAGYELEYSTDGASWADVSQYSSGDSAIHAQLSASTTYQYRVRAYSSEGRYSDYATTEATTNQSTSPGTALGCGYDASRVSPEPTVTGTKHYITPATTTQQVNAMNIQSGDAVLFQAGGIWYMPTSSYKLNLKSGVYYGRYGAGANPRFTAQDAVWGTTWEGMFHGGFGSISDLTIDGIHLEDGPRYTTTSGTHNLYGFLIGGSSGSNIKIYNCRVRRTRAGGIFISGKNGIHVDNCEIWNTGGGGGNESISIANGCTNFLVENMYNHENIKAGIDIKNGARFGVLRNSVFINTSSDPNIYLSGCQDIEVYNNFCSYKNFAAKWEEWSGNAGVEVTRSNLAISLEETSYDTPNKNINIHDNWIVDSGRVGLELKLFVTDASQQSLTGPFMENIHIHNNTIAFSNYEYEWGGAIDVRDLRVSPTLNPADWVNIVIEDNIIYDNGISQVETMLFRNNTAARCTIQNNIYKTGATGGVGISAAYTSNPMFVDQPNQNYNLQDGSPATGFGSESLLNCPL